MSESHLAQETLIQEASFVSTDTAQCHFLHSPRGSESQLCCIQVGSIPIDRDDLVEIDRGFLLFLIGIPLELCRNVLRKHRCRSIFLKCVPFGTIRTLSLPSVGNTAARLANITPFGLSHGHSINRT